MTEIKLLYFDGCPSWKPALENIKQVLESEHIPAKITLLKIDDAEQAQKEHFLGSPSFQVNGIDLWPEQREIYSLSCRVYQTPNGLSGFPTVEMLQKRMCEISPSSNKNK